MCSFRCYLALLASFFILCQTSFSQVTKLGTLTAIREEFRSTITHQAVSWMTGSNNNTKLVGPCQNCSSFDAADTMRPFTGFTSGEINRNLSSNVSVWNGKLLFADSSDQLDENFGTHVDMAYNLSNVGVTAPASSISKFRYLISEDYPSAFNPSSQVEGGSVLFSLSTWPNYDESFSNFDDLSNSVSTPFLRINKNQVFPININENNQVSESMSGERTLGIKVSPMEIFSVFNSRAEGDKTKIAGLTMPSSSGSTRIGIASQPKNIELETIWGSDKVPYGTNITSVKFPAITGYTETNGYIVALSTSNRVDMELDPSEENPNSKPHLVHVLKYAESRNGWSTSAAVNLSLDESNNEIDNVSILPEIESIIYSVKQGNDSYIKIAKINNLLTWNGTMSVATKTTLSYGTANANIKATCPVVNGNYIAFVSNQPLAASDGNLNNDVYLYSMDANQFKNPVTGEANVPLLVSQNPSDGRSYSGSSGIDDTDSLSPRCKLDIDSTGTSLVLSYITRSSGLAAVATNNISNTGNIASNGGVTIATSVGVSQYSGASGRSSTTRINLNSSFPNATTMPNGRKFPVLMEYVLSNGAVVTSREQFTLTSSGAERFLTLSHRMPATTASMKAYTDGFGVINFNGIAANNTGTTVTLPGDFNLDGIKNLEDDAIFISQTGFSHSQPCNTWASKNVQDNLALDALNVNRDTTGAGNLGVINGADGAILGLCSGNNG